MVFHMDMLCYLFLLFGDLRFGWRMVPVHCECIIIITRVALARTDLYLSHVCACDVTHAGIRVFIL